MEGEFWAHIEVEPLSVVLKCVERIALPENESTGFTWEVVDQELILEAGVVGLSHTIERSEN